MCQILKRLHRLGQSPVLSVFKKQRTDIRLLIVRPQFIFIFVNDLHPVRQQRFPFFPALFPFILPAADSNPNILQILHRSQQGIDPIMIQDPAYIKDLQRFFTEIPSDIRPLGNLCKVRSRRKCFCHGRDLLPVYVFTHFQIRDIETRQEFFILRKISLIFMDGHPVFHTGHCLPVHRELPVDITVEKADRDVLCLQVFEQSEVQSRVRRQMIWLRKAHGFRAAFRIHEIKPHTFFDHLFQFPDLMLPLLRISMDRIDLIADGTKRLQHLPRPQLTGPITGLLQRIWKEKDTVLFFHT